MHAALPLAAILLLTLAGCDEPKPRRPPPAAAPANAAAPTLLPPASVGLPKRAEMANFSLDQINEAVDPVNTPAKIRSGVATTFSGFGFDPVAMAPGKAVDIVVDGVAYGTAYGADRPDVATYFKTPALENSGFTVTLPAGAIKAGPHQAIVRVVAADKAGYFDSVTIGFVAK